MRQYPPPDSPWIMRQTWSDLLFMHWRVDPDFMQSLLPEPLEVDTFDGSAWIAVVPFLMTGIRMHWLPPVPGASHTLELNVRTYVKYGGKHGVFFFSLDAENSLIVHTARAWFGLPYYKARMKLKKATYTRYESLRTHVDAPAAELRAVYRPLGEVRAPQPDTLEHFLTERYCLMTARQGKPVSIGEIDHRPWPLRKAEVEIEANSMTEPLGIQVDGRPILHYASSIDVRLWTMQEVRK